jgi:nicotinic acid phosphoribosyltransferase
MTDAYQLTMSQAAYNLGKHEQKAVFRYVFSGRTRGRAVLQWWQAFGNWSALSINLPLLMMTLTIYNTPAIQFTEPFLNYLRDFRFSGRHLCFCRG